MPIERQTRTLVAAFLFVLALFVAMNYLVDNRSIVEWWLPVLLLAAGLFLAFANRLRPQAEAAAVGAARAYTVREYSLPTSVVTSSTLAAGPEQAGEVNVREPRDEEESQPTIASPETLTPPAEPVEVDVTPEPEAEEVIAAPETLTPPAAPAEPETKTDDERAMDDVNTAGEFAPPSTLEGTLNPPTESDTVPGAVVQHLADAQRHDPARPEMPLSEVKPETPEVSQAERLETEQTLVPPRDTHENEYQSGEHVAARQPTSMPPITTQTTGEGMGAGVEMMRPEEKAVLDTTSAPPQPTDVQAVAANDPEVVDAVMNQRESEATSEGLAGSERITPTQAAAEASGSTADDLTVIEGIGGKMAGALRAAGITSYVKLSMTSDEELRQAIEGAGLRFAPSLTTWREQALFLARGDRAGFEAMRRSLRAGRKGGSGDGD